MSQLIPIIIVIVVALLAFTVGAFLASRKGYTKAGQTIARCRQGHLFTTVWSARFSRKQYDLGWARIQRCPVGDHWSLVRVVDEAGLSAEDKKSAAQHRDSAEAGRVVPYRRPRRRRRR